MTTSTDVINRLDAAIAAAGDMTTSMIVRQSNVITAMENTWKTRYSLAAGEQAYIVHSTIDAKTDTLSQLRIELIVPSSPSCVPEFLKTLAAKVDAYVSNPATPREKAPMAIDTAIADLLRLKKRMEDFAVKAPELNEETMVAVNAINKCIESLKTRKGDDTQLASLTATLATLESDLGKLPKNRFEGDNIQLQQIVHLLERIKSEFDLIHDQYGGVENLPADLQARVQEIEKSINQASTTIAALINRLYNFQEQSRDQISDTREQISHTREQISHKLYQSQIQRNRYSADQIKELDSQLFHTDKSLTLYSELYHTV